MIFIRKILFPFSLLYAFVVRLRNFLYDSGIKKAAVFKTKTVCIGNLSVGGTGKTPMVEYLIRALKDEFKVAVLSRGYKRRSTGYVLANEKSTVSLLGDEAYQIHTKFQNVAVAVDANRQNGITKLEATVQPDVILLDDAFQHRKVKAGFTILLTAYHKLYCDDWCLPTGTLRDNRREARRADLIVVTKCPATITDQAKKEIQKKLAAKPHQQVLFSTLVYEPEFRSKNSTITVSDLKGKHITLVTGIADPTPLLTYLEQQSVSFEHLSYPDHHFFSAKQIAALNDKQLIVTTEKDYMRLQDALSNVFYISVRHEFLETDGASLNAAIRGFMKQDA